jgi:acyl-CoA thioesterase FadM
MLRHEAVLTIRFDDADPAGVVFYPRALALAHGVVEDMIRGSALGWDAWFASPVHAAPLRRAEADFFHPLRAGQTVTARAGVAEIGETSVTFSVEFLAEGGALAARFRTVHVLIAKDTGRPVALTEAMRAVFAGG